MPASSAVPEEFALLVSAFAVLTDPRFARGKVHPLPGVLALVVLGLMATLHRLHRQVSLAEMRTALATFRRHLLAPRRGRPEAGGVLSLLRSTALNLLRGKATLWTTTMPLTAHAESINGHPSAVLTA
jgi:hypothetical protein